MIGSLTQRLFLYLAMIMVALLTLEATYAASGCAPVAAMTEDDGECDDCKDEDRQHCQSYCLALCQTLPAYHASSPDSREGSSLTFLPLRPRFPPLPNGGPEPPPPRMLRCSNQFNINGDTIMKKYIIAAAVLLGSSSAAFAAAPDQVAALAMSCCDLVLACCDAAMDCCP